MDILACHRDGKHEQVWASLSQKLRSEPEYAESDECAALMTATFSALRKHVSEIILILREHGYRFWCETEGRSPLEPHSPAVLLSIAKAKSEWGSFPLSIEWCARICGRIDLRQVPEEATSGQAISCVAPGLSRERHKEAAPRRPMPLGEFDPLCFEIEELTTEEVEDQRKSERQELGGRFRLLFAPDAYHKANISGGDPYSVWLPDNSPDPWFEAAGCSFMTYLRVCIARGGFWGARQPLSVGTDVRIGTHEVGKGFFLPDHPALRKLQSITVSF